MRWYYLLLWWGGSLLLYLAGGSVAQSISFLGGGAMLVLSQIVFGMSLGYLLAEHMLKKKVVAKPK